MRSLVLVSFATLTLAPACTATPDATDELDGESAADGEEGKGDAAAAFTFFDVRPDKRQCSFDAPPDCGGGFFVSRVNRSTTQCGRGFPQERCKVYEIDWSGTAMPTSVWMAHAANLAAGNPMVLRGELVPAPNDAGSTLAVTEIWLPSSNEWAEGVFTLMKDNGIRCIKAPCPNLSEQKLNSNLSAMASDVDFEPSGADSQSLERALEQLYGDDGVIVVGYRYYEANDGKGRTANNFYTRAATPLF